MIDDIFNDHIKNNGQKNVESPRYLITVQEVEKLYSVIKQPSGELGKVIRVATSGLKR